MSTGNVGVQNWFGRIRASLKERYDTLLPNQKAYVNAAFLFVVYLALKPFGWEVTQGLLIMSMLSWGMALTADLLAFYGRVLDSHLAKLLAVAAVGFGANIAIALAAQQVNDFVGIDPGRFVHTIAFVSMFVAAALILIGMSILFVVGTGFVVMYLFFLSSDERFISLIFPWYRSDSRVPYKRLTLAVQLMSFLAVSGFAYSWVKDGQEGYGVYVEDKARWFLYTFEMYQKAPCMLLDDQRVAFLDDDQVLVASKEGDKITFHVQRCVGKV